MITLHSTIAACAIVSLVGIAPVGAQTPGPEAAARRNAAQRVPIGATIKLRTTDGQRFKAVLFAVDFSRSVTRGSRADFVTSTYVPSSATTRISGVFRTAPVFRPT